MKFKNLILTTLNIKRTFEDKRWISLKEFPRFFSLVLWSYSMSELNKPFRVLMSRISTLIKLSGWTFSFKYLKEVLRIVVRILAENEVVKSSSVFVKTDKRGWPTIIPIEIRDIILKDYSLDFKKLVVGALLSILSIHRVFPTKVEPSVSTVIAPFSGLVKTLDQTIMVKSLKELGLYSSYTKNSRCSLFWSEASGPNTIIAGMGSINDALALLHSPSQLWAVFYSLLLRLNIGLILYLILTITLFGPVYYLLVFLGVIKPFVNGRLSVVYDQAGKARVIAITSYWIQTCLKPLHLFLFNKLKDLAGNDGTFDQLKPFNDLLARCKGKTFYGYDLSAATDRLPIDLQVQILDLIGFRLPWKTLLDINWYPNFRCQFDTVRYSVGQPMGALSSWAMLAITHHVIVKVAAIRKGIMNFSDYCILGDDVVIANDDVAEEYRALMSCLGLEINLQKSVNSKIFTEFAKRLQGPSIDFSPLGAGLVLQTLRSTAYCVRFPFELFEKGLISLNSIGERLSSAPKFFRKRVNLVLWSTILGTYISQFCRGSALNPVVTGISPTPLETFMFNSYIDRFFIPVLSELRDEFTLSKKKLRYESIVFFSGIWFTNVTRSGYHSVPGFLNFLNLGFWSLLGKYLWGIIDLFELHCKVYLYSKFDASHFQRDHFALLPDLLNALDIKSVASIEWGKKAKVRDMTKTMARIVKMADMPLKNIHQIYVNHNMSPSAKFKLQQEAAVRRALRFMP